MRIKLTNLLIISVLCLFCASCTVNEQLPLDLRFESFDSTIDDIVTELKNTKYCGVEDNTIISEKVDTLIGVGKIVDVEYSYGAFNAHRYYYVDPNGETVRLRKLGGYKNNGYPSTDSFVYDINRYGYVEVDWFMIIFVAAIVLFLYFYFFVC